jgi:predicted enzyme related to lactoylglutathione lyase
MKKILLPTLALLASFCFGFAFKSIIGSQPNQNPALKRVTGIGGIFFKCKDPKKLRDWYQTHLGLNTNQYGSVFEFRQGADPSKKGFSQWSPFGEKTKYFEPSPKDFMINYRVADLKALISELKKEGVTLTDTMESYNYGKFVHILDLEGNKIELWEPNDVEYEKMGLAAGYPTTK